MRLLILNTTCCWRRPTAPFLQLGDELARRGVHVRHIVGGGACCSFYGTLKNWDDVQCFGTQDRVTRDIERIGNPVQNLRQFETPEMHQQIEAWWEHQRQVPLNQRTYEGLQLYNLIRGSLARHLHRPLDPPQVGPNDTLALDETERLVADRFCRGAALGYEVAGAILQHINPDTILYFNGYYYLEWIFQLLAQQRGIRTVAHESSCFADRMFFDTNGVIGNRQNLSSGKVLHQLDAIRLNAIQQQQLDSYLGGILEGRVNNIPQRTTEPLEALRARLKIPPGKRLVLVLGQVAYDTVVLYDQGTFLNTLDFYQACITATAEMPDVHLVLRLHPHEVIVNNNWTLQQLQNAPSAPHVTLVHSQEANTYQLMQLSDCGVVINSQAGLEMAAFGKPVVVTGNAFYRNKGFTWDVSQPEELLTAIRKALAAATSPGIASPRANVFLYHHIFEYLVPFDPGNDRFDTASIEKILRLLDPSGKAHTPAAPPPPAIAAATHSPPARHRRAEEFPRLLLVTEAPLGNQSGYGITLANLFQGWPQDRIVQIHRDTGYPADTTVCRQFLPLYDMSGATTYPVFSRKFRQIEMPLRLLLGHFDIYGHHVNAARARHWLRPFKPQLLFSSPTTYATTRMTLHLAQRLGIPYTAHIMDDWLAQWEHGVRPVEAKPNEPQRQQRRNKITHRFFARAAARQVISQQMAAAYQQRYRHTFSTFHNAIDLNQWDQGPRPYETTQTPFTIRYTGAIWHNIQMPSLQHFAEAIAELAGEDIAIRLEIYTHESYARQYAPKIQQLPHVVFKDLVPYEQVPKLMREADALLVPVTFDEKMLLFSKYSMPTKVPEYMISGTPVILYGPQDAAPVAYARNAAWGYVIDQPGKENLKQRLVELTRNPRLRQQAGQPAQLLAREHHDLSKVREAFWEELLRAWH